MRRSRAAALAQAMCGVMQQFRAVSSGLSARGGSCESTSSPAAKMVPLFSASARSCSLTSGPRPVLMRMALGFICFKRAALTSSRVESVRGQCRLMMSQWAKSSSSSVFLISGGSWKGDLDVYACTSMPKPMAMRAVLQPVCPRPMIPIFLPLSSMSGVSQKQKSGLLVQRPLCISSVQCCTRWVMLRMWAKTICATDGVLYAGMLVTVIPRSLAAAVSMMLYPVASTPMYFNWGRAAMVVASSTTLFVSRMSAPAARSSTSAGAVRS